MSGRSRTAGARARPGPPRPPLLARIEARARDLGFAAVAMGPLAPPRRLPAYQRWLADGWAGTMTYLASAAHRAGRRDPAGLLAGARSAVVVAAPHPPPAVGPISARAAAGAVAAYAVGADYHPAVKRRLEQLVEEVARAVGRPVRHRSCVDSAPLLERELAASLGLGFVGKNTMLIVPGVGSSVLLGELLLDVDLPAAPAAAPSGRGCGRCRACLDACPTGALVAPYRLDARRCISYLTIEHQGPIPVALRPAIGGAIFGCDLCQAVCPHNAARSLPALPELVAAPSRAAPDLLALIGLGTHQLRRFQQRTALRRIDQPRLLRNLCVALGNLGDARAVPALVDRLDHASPLVRGHAAWALGRLGYGARCRAARERESDPEAAGELAAALTAGR